MGVEIQVGPGEEMGVANASVHAWWTRQKLPVLSLCLNLQSAQGLAPFRLTQTPC